MRLALILLAMTALGLFSMGASIYIAESAQDDAAAINKAGSLRMQSYRIAALLQAEAPADEVTAAARRFESILEAPALTKTTEEAGAAPGRYYRQVNTTWADTLAPDLRTVVATGGEEGGQRYLAEVDEFVESVDTMVAALQHQAERRIQLLRLSQGAAVVLALTLALTGVYLIHTGIMRPLSELMGMAERVRGGDFSGRVGHTRRDEIGLLGRSFNTMAADLETLHAGLERQVEIKTRELRRSNEALQLLYDAARRLTLGRVDNETVEPILQHLGRVTEIRLISVCIADPEEHTAHQTFSSVPGHAPSICQAPHCGLCLRGETTAAKRPGHGVTTIVLEHQGQRHGVMVLEYPDASIPEQWKMRLADAIAEKIALAIGLAREARRQRRLALHEERSVIARELHDSLAQSLSYLKIQVTRLDAGLRNQSVSATTSSAVTELREGLNTAYGHLRELLTTFRLKMNEPGLGAALRAATEEYQRRGDGTEIRLEQLHTGLNLDSNAEVHLLHIAREALANVVSHAQATHAWIRLCVDEEGWVTLSVDDDGIGIPDAPDRPHHYGIRIMTERANSLGGTLQVTRREPSGTHLEVRFPARNEAMTESIV